MKGCFFLGAGHEPAFEIREMKFKPLAPKEVLIKVCACGVCGTDVHIYKGEEGSAAVNPPVVLGHEFAGIVQEVWKRGYGDKARRSCLAGSKYVLRYMQTLPDGEKQTAKIQFALGVNANGGFAEYAVCPESQCFKINNDIDFEVAAMSEPLACVIHGIDLAEIKSGQTVAVIGTGAIGFLMMQVAKLRGASTVIMCAVDDAKCELAKELGADYAINSKSENLVQMIREYSRADGADVVIECVGNPIATEQAFQIAGKGARVVLFSVPNPKETYELKLFDVFKKELTIVGSLINPDTHQRAVNLINSGRIEIKKLITQVYDIEHLEEAIKCQMSLESIKVIVKPKI